MLNYKQGENMNLLMIAKKDDDILSATRVTTIKGRRKYLNKELEEVMLVELVGLDFKKEEIIEIRKLEKLQQLIKKGFSLRLYETETSYGLSVVFHTKLLGEMQILKQQKISELFNNAESWANDLLEQFNSDQENIL